MHQQRCTAEADSLTQVGNEADGVGKPTGGWAQGRAGGGSGKDGPELEMGQDTIHKVISVWMQEGLKERVAGCTGSLVPAGEGNGLSLILQVMMPAPRAPRGHGTSGMAKFPLGRKSPALLGKVSGQNRDCETRLRPIRQVSGLTTQT